MWCIRRNKKKEGASHRNLKLNWEGNTPTSSSKIWDTLSFCRVPVISRKLRWLTVSCHPCPMLSYSPSKGFQVLICVEKLHNLSKNDCVLFFISVFLKSTKWLYFSVCKAGCLPRMAPAWRVAPCGGRAFLCLSGEAWTESGTLASNSCHACYWTELSSAK